MTNPQYIIDITKKFLELNKDEIEDRGYFELRSKSSKFKIYRDDSVEISFATDTQAMHLSILKPHHNPFMYVDDNGKVFRYHGDRIHYKEYIEEKLNDSQKTKAN